MKHVSDYDCAIACQRAYHGNFNGYTIRENGRTQGYYDSSRRLLVIKGTDDGIDIRRDLDARMDDGVHAGFKLAWLTIQDQVKDAVGSDDELIITGHSLGGAVANLASLELPTKRVVTFGAPRLFSKAKMAEYPVVQHRYVFWDDAVAWLPMFWWGYQHAVKPMYLRWWPTFWRAKDRHSMKRYARALSNRVQLWGDDKSVVTPIKG